jgi:bifunctional DNase/RNase
MQPVVLLVDLSERRVMPIWIGPNEAAVIQGELAGTPFPRPTTHDLLERVIQRLNGTPRRVIITHEKNNTY